MRVSLASDAFVSRSRYSRRCAFLDFYLVVGDWIVTMGFRYGERLNLLKKCGEVGKLCGVYLFVSKKRVIFARAFAWNLEKYKLEIYIIL